MFLFAFGPLERVGGPNRLFLEALDRICPARRMAQCFLNLASSGTRIIITCGHVGTAPEG